ncbi:hypothetical protein MMC13_003462 [Lambiella insularis]|nr:hypothetical protein [Lambiella insularis]
MTTNPPTPPTLYRVQHQTSFTRYEPSIGFEANVVYWMAYSHWFNGKKVREHLDWNSRPLEPSPFISLFDNLADAKKRASFHRSRGDRDVFVAQIDTSRCIQHRLSIQFLDGPIEMNGWIHPETKTMLFPMREVGGKLRLEPGTVQRSEWLALGCIPQEMVTRLG